MTEIFISQKKERINEEKEETKVTKIAARGEGSPNNYVYGVPLKGIT